MAELKSISISDIHIGERLREIEEDHAQAIAASIKEVGLQSPITVRPTPAAKGGKFTLVAGAHRLRACEIVGLSDVDALVVKADGTEAQLLEITENLFRNELSVIDRAIFVQKYREIWEEQNGAITRGGDRKSKGHGDLLIGFSEHVADRLGVSEASAKRLDRIARQLHPELKSTFRGTPVADQTTVLLKLAKLPPHLQRRAAIGWRETQDVKQVFTLLSDKPAAPTISASEAMFSKLVDLWSRADNDAKTRFLDHIGVSIDAVTAAE